MLNSSFQTNNKAWIVVFAASLYFFFEFFQVNVFNALDPYLLKAFGLQAGALGNLSAFYFYAVVLCLIPAGLVLDRFSTKRVILTEMLLCILAVFIFAGSQTVWEAKIARLLLGIGGCCVLLGCVRLATRWFPAHRMALVIGLIVTFAMTGGILAQTPFTLLTDALGWRQAMVVNGIVGIILFFLMSYFIEDFPKEPIPGVLHDEPNHISLSDSLKFVVKNPQNWFCGLYGSLMNLPVFLLGAMWGVLYLVQDKGMHRDHASVATSMIFLGLILGSPLIGFISDYFGRRKLCMQIAALLALVIIMLIISLEHVSFEVELALFFLLGLVTSAQVLVYSVIAESNPPKITASAESVAATTIMAGGFVQGLFGLLMEWHWQHVFTSDQVPLYSKTDYHLAMMIMPVSFILSFVCSLMIKETYGQAYQEQLDFIKR